MTPDQIYFILADRKLLESKSIAGGGTKMNAEQAIGFGNESGLVKGRDKDGNPLLIPILKDGKTKTQLIRERIEAEKKRMSDGS